jgi:hypothetical protein
MAAFVSKFLSNFKHVIIKLIFISTWFVAGLENEINNTIYFVL